MILWTLILSLISHLWLVSPAVGIQVGDEKKCINYSNTVNHSCVNSASRLSPPSSWPALIENKDKTLFPHFTWGHGLTHKSYKSLCHPFSTSQKSILHRNMVYIVLRKYSIPAVSHDRGDFSCPSGYLSHITLLSLGFIHGTTHPSK